MNIQPTHVTFEQAKLLKEKGFDVECIYHYGKTNDYISIGSDIPATNWNKLIDDHMDEVELYSRPEQWQVVEWLRVKYGIWVQVFILNKTFAWKFTYIETQHQYCEYAQQDKGFSIPQEAYSAAFDYVLKELI